MGLEHVEASRAWDLLYEREPELYDRLVEGEPLHPLLLRAMSVDGAEVLEVGAGTGRLTLPLAARAAHVYALEPVAAMRAVLEAHRQTHGWGNVTLLDGRAARIPLPDQSVDHCVSASSFGADPQRGGDAGLRELLRVTRPKGTICIIWPDDAAWFRAHGFEHVAVDDGLEVRFRDLRTALDCAQVFYGAPVTAHFRHTRRPVIAFSDLGVPVPLDLCRLTLS